MARVTIPVVTANKNLAAGIDLTAIAVAADAGNDHKMLNGGERILLLVWTASASGVDIDFDSVADRYGRLGGATEEGPTTIGASKFFAFGPFSPPRYTQRSGSYINSLQVNLASLSGTVKLVAVAIP